MDSLILTRGGKTLSVGDFLLSVSSLAFPPEKLPAFIVPFAPLSPPDQPPDFLVKLYSYPPDSEECGEPLFGSFHFSRPCHVFRLSDGSIRWNWENADKELLHSWQISPDWRTWKQSNMHPEESIDSLFYAMFPLFAYGVLPRGGMVLHGVVMEWQGKGVIFTAASGTGKTTHTRMWRDRENALILNGDRALCRRQKDAWYAYGMPWAGSSGEYVNRRVPITAVVCLEQGADNTVERLTPAQSGLKMLERVFAPDWDAKLMDCAIGQINDLVESVPFLRFACRPDFSSVHVLKEALAIL